MRTTLAAAFIAVTAGRLMAGDMRVDRFDWMIAKTEHFDIHYDSGTELLVPRMARYLEGAWVDVGRALGVEVKERIPFFFYSNHNEFEQTNIVPIGEGTGGVTEAFKNRLVIFNDGSQEWLRHVVYHEFGHVAQFAVIYGGWWRSVRLLKSPFYPLWMMEGMAEYVSGDIDEAASDMVVRDAVYSNALPHLQELHGFAHLKPGQVTLGYKTGEAAILFLAEEYGPEKVGQLLVASKDYFDIDTALRGVIGCGLDEFDFRFREWARHRWLDHLATARPPSAFGPKVTSGDALPQRNEAPVFSPDGRWMYFFSDRAGPPQLYRRDMRTGREKVLLRAERGRYEYVQTKGRALAISPDGRWLAFCGEKRQREKLFLYDINRRRVRRVNVPLDEIRSPSFAPDGNTIVCVGLVRGFSDIYRIDLDGRIVHRLTDSPRDERDPVFSADGARLFFSAEITDPATGDFTSRDLFEMSSDGTQERRLTQVVGVASEPEPVPDGGLVFVRDRDDAGRLGYNLYRIDADASRILPLTDTTGGAFSPRWNAHERALYYVAYHSREKHVYRLDGIALATATTVAAAGRAAVERGKGGAGPAWTEWPTMDRLSLVQGPPAPYRFRASTDLFLPFLFYSTLDGLVFANVWQASDYLGNHQLQQQLQYASRFDLIDVAVFYTYARFRPQFTLGTRYDRYFEDFDRDLQRRRLDTVGFVGYPLDRFNTVRAGIGATSEQDRDLERGVLEADVQDRFAFAGYSFDTVTGRYLMATRGRRLDLIFQRGIETANGNQRYGTGSVEWVEYTPLPRESTLATRLSYGRSSGRDAQVFRLGGSDRLRALSGGGLSTRKSNALLGSAELRIRLRYLNARTRLFFPDFFFKAAYLTIFDDIGYAWDTAAERRRIGFGEAFNSAGAGITWPTFILQTFQLNLSVTWARRTDNGSDVWYVTLGPSF